MFHVSPYVIPSGWLGSKHQLTNYLSSTGNLPVCLSRIEPYWTTSSMVTHTSAASSCTGNCIGLPPTNGGGGEGGCNEIKKSTAYFPWRGKKSRSETRSLYNSKGTYSAATELHKLPFCWYQYVTNMCAKCHNEIQITVRRNLWSATVAVIRTQHQTWWVIHSLGFCCVKNRQSLVHECVKNVQRFWKTTATTTTTTKKKKKKPVFMSFSTVCHSINSSNNSPLSHSVFQDLFLPYWSFQLYISLLKFPSAMISSFATNSDFSFCRTTTVSFMCPFSLLLEPTAAGV